MAPGGLCLASWEGALDPYESLPHQHQLQTGKQYVAYLDIESGSGGLGVTGQVVSQLQCSSVGADSVCTFVASGNGVVAMNATAGGQGAEYLLTFGYP
jgi:hypothetical protein